MFSKEEGGANAVKKDRPVALEFRPKLKKKNTDHTFEKSKQHFVYLPWEDASASAVSSESNSNMCAYQHAINAAASSCAPCPAGTQRPGTALQPAMAGRSFRQTFMSQGIPPASAAVANSLSASSGRKTIMDDFNMPGILGEEIMKDELEE